ncbi:hypothetical protein B8W95_14120, partial [Staphylococcus pasteuri]
DALPPPPAAGGAVAGLVGGERVGVASPVGRTMAIAAEPGPGISSTRFTLFLLCLGSEDDGEARTKKRPPR